MHASLNKLMALVYWFCTPKEGCDEGPTERKARADGSNHHGPPELFRLCRTTWLDKDVSTRRDRGRDDVRRSRNRQKPNHPPLPFANRNPPPNRSGRYL